MTPAHFDDVLLARQEAVATITLNRPDRRNAWTLTMGAEVEEALAICDSDPEVRVVVVTGAGACFCVGADLSGRDILAPGGEHDRPHRPRLTPPQVAKPVIAAINGHAVGIGVTFPMQCDVRIVAEDAKVGLPFVRRGVIAEAGGHWILSRLIGFAVAAELLLTGRLVNGAEATALGLCSRAVPADQVLPTAYSMAEEIATFTSPLAVAATKRLMWDSLEMTRSRPPSGSGSCSAGSPVSPTPGKAWPPSSSTECRSGRRRRALCCPSRTTMRRRADERRIPGRRVAR